MKSTLHTDNKQDAYLNVSRKNNETLIEWVIRVMDSESDIEWLIRTR